MNVCEDKIEKILTESSFSNPDHKKKLWSRLSSAGQKLSDEELEMAAGGIDFISDTIFRFNSDEVK